MTQGGRAAAESYLAIDTSTTIGSVALRCGSKLAARTLLPDRGRHASRLIPAIARVLDDAGVSKTDLTAIVVGEGPGSFTGVRVAAATAKGLAYALGIPVFAVSSLAGTAFAADHGPVRYVLFDARADRVYGACYALRAAGAETLVVPHGGDLSGVLEGPVPAGAVFIGEGAERHRGAIEAAGHSVVPRGSDEGVADGLLRYLELAQDLEPLRDVGSWEPAYIRAWSGEPTWTA